MVGLCPSQQTHCLAQAFNKSRQTSIVGHVKSKWVRDRLNLGDLSKVTQTSWEWLSLHSTYALHFFLVFVQVNQVGFEFLKRSCPYMSHEHCLGRE